MTWRRGVFAAICRMIVAFMLLTPLAHACGSAQTRVIAKAMLPCHEGHAMPGHAMPGEAMHGIPQSGPMWCCVSDSGQAIPSAVAQLSKPSPAKSMPGIAATAFLLPALRGVEYFGLASYQYLPAGVPRQLSVHVLLI